MGNDNFFLETKQSSKRIKNAEPVRRLNDYDYNILKEEAYKDISNELFKLEYKISRLEEELKGLDMQIQSARDICDYDTVETLLHRKYLIQEDLSNITEIYNDKSLSAKISGGIFNTFKEKFEKFNSYAESIKRIILSALPANISALFEIKQSLNKLESINKNVDELMTMHTPYGEASDRYEQLSKYIMRANAIQTSIAKSMRK